MHEITHDPAKMPKNQKHKTYGKTISVNDVTIDDNYLTDLTKAQYNSFRKILSSNPSGCNQASGILCSTLKIISSTSIQCSMPHIFDWIIDYGATHHITASFDLLRKPINIDSTVNLPNGHTTYITNSGSVQLTVEIVLFNVLYIPSFHFNLISSQVVNSLMTVNFVSCSSILIVFFRTFNTRV